MESVLETIYNAVLEGDAAGTKAGVDAALAAGLNPDAVLADGLIAAMGEVGRLFEENEYFVPEMLVAARAMQGGLAILKPHLAAGGSVSTGKAVVGTVKGDLHDIGKNLVAMMLEGAGFEVIDIGIDVPVETYLEAIDKHRPEILGMSALLTTTMPYMKVVIDALEEKGIRSDTIVLVGGAPLNDAFAQSIGADAYCRDAATAVETATEFMAKRQGSLAARMAEAS